MPTDENINLLLSLILYITVCSVIIYFCNDNESVIHMLVRGYTRAKIDMRANLAHRTSLK